MTRRDKDDGRGTSRNAAPQVHICVRRTLDWHDEAIVSARILPEFRPKLDAWNATFTMRYHVFRQRLKAIAELNLSHVEGAVRSHADEVPSGHLIVPVDDDDWFAPDLVMHLQQAHDPQAAGYLWTRETLQSQAFMVALRGKVGRFIGRPERHVCKTNNYACLSEPELMPFLRNHVHASEYFTAHAQRIRRIHATLGIHNRNLASQTTLAWGRPSITRWQLVALHRRHRALYASWTAPAELQWAARYVHLMHELMADIAVK
jgi:hypothetical protein